MIRNYRFQDHPAVVGLLERVLPGNAPWNEPSAAVRRKWFRQDDLIWVAEAEDGQIVGCVMAGEDGVRGWVYSLAVLPKFRRRGIGTQLLAAVERELQARSCPKVNLQIRGNPTEVISFYKACGYQMEDRTSLGKSLDDVDLRFATSRFLQSIPVQDEFHLSPLIWDDFDSIYRLLNQSDVFHRCTGDIPYPYPAHVLEAWMFQAIERPLQESRRLSWALRDAKKQLVGEVSLIDLTEGEQAEIGYWLGLPHWGRGLATDAARAVLRVGFEVLDLRRIHAKVFADNAASKSVLRRLGFAHEGTLREGYFLDGKPLDDEVHGLLRSDWQSAVEA